MTRPTLYPSNFASYRTPGMHGPGRKLTIMARPRAWEVGEGTAHALMPQGFEVAAMQRAVALRNAVVPEAIDAVRAYRAMIEERWATEAKALRPLPPDVGGAVPRARRLESGARRSGGVRWLTSS